MKTDHNISFFKEKLEKISELIQEMETEIKTKTGFSSLDIKNSLENPSISHAPAYSFSPMTVFQFTILYNIIALNKSLDLFSLAVGNENLQKEAEKKKEDFVGLMDLLGVKN